MELWKTLSPRLEYWVQIPSAPLGCVLGLTVDFSVLPPFLHLSHSCRNKVVKVCKPLRTVLHSKHSKPNTQRHHHLQENWLLLSFLKLAVSLTFPFTN